MPSTLEITECLVNIYFEHIFQGVHWNLFEVTLYKKSAKSRFIEPGWSIPRSRRMRYSNIIFLGNCFVWRYFAGTLVTNISWEICSMQIQALFWDGNKKQPVQCQEMVYPDSNRSTVPYSYSFYQNISKNQKALKIYVLFIH